MGKRRITLALAALALVGLIPFASPAEAACRPRTLGDLGATPTEQAEAAAAAAAEVSAPGSVPVEPPTTPTTVGDPAPSEPADAPPANGDPAAPPPTAGDPAAAEPAPPEAPAAAPPPVPCRFVYRMEFPVVGGGGIGSVFGDVRAGGDRWHAGVDVFAPKLTPVVAVKAGTVSSIHAESGDCCWLTVRHDDGWSSWYLHLNNDSYGTDDGRGVGIRPDLVEGMRVEQGELLGWVGDSGNAETAVPHLHFELHAPWGAAIDPGPSLFRAMARRASAFPDTAGRPEFVGAFADDDGTSGAAVLEVLVALGAPVACGEFGLSGCPSEPADRALAVDWLSILVDGFVDPHPQPPPPPPLIPDPSALTTAIACADNACLPPVVPVTRGEVAALIAGFEGRPEGADPALALLSLHAEGRVDVCSPGEPPPDGPLTRLELARFLLRAFGYLPAPPCALIS